VRCARCDADNRAEARFCRACGAALARTCPGCGAESSPDALFCDRCGTRLVAADARDPAVYTPPDLAARILSGRGALEGERRHVTVLFADVAGFTSIAERTDPEEVRALLERCFERILEQVHRYEGTVNQFAGDGIMALFGAPVALEDAPRRAVMAALGIQRALAVLREELLATSGVDFRLRIGINSGLVVVGRIGNDLRMEYTAIGDTINLGARLQALAEPGTVLVSEATERLVAGFFELRDRGRLAVRGKAEPVHAFEVVAERPDVAGRIDARAQLGLTHFVGRERELALLVEAFESARGGQGQVVFLVGEAGLGKSRLLYELRRRLAGEAHHWIEGRCASYGTTTALLPVIDALRRFAGIDDRDDEAAALSKVERTVAGLEGDLAWTLPFVRQLLSLPAGDERIVALDPATRRSETFRALQALTLQAARQHPLVVVIEDLHWIDPASEEYLTFLADLVPATRAVLVCSHRPGYRHPFGDRSYHVRVTLRPLPAADTAVMTGDILGSAELPPALRDLIAQKAEGNPFFVEELTRSLLEEGALRHDDGRVVLARDLAGIAVPDSIHGVLMARLDRLADESKRAIQVASVIGREFAVRLLERIGDLGDRVQGLVEELRGLELIYEKAAHPELAYMFKHALTHDVAYESILVQRRKALHRAIGRTIEELYADRLAEHYETLALHFARGEDWERALDYHTRAAEKACEAYANHAVIEHCGHALTIADRLGAAVDDGRRRRLEELLAASSFLVSEFRRSGEAYARAAEHSADPETRALTLSRAATSYFWASAYAEARAANEECLAIARRIASPAAEAAGLAGRAFFAVVTRGALEEGETELARALGLATHVGNEELVGVIQNIAAEVAEWRGEYRRAIACCEKSLAIGRRLRLPHLMIWPLWFRGKAACCLGDYGRALGDLNETVALCERIGDRAWKTRLLNTLGWCYAEIGAHDRALRHNEEAARIARELGDPEIISNAEINLAGNHLVLGDRERTLAYLEPIRDTLARAGDPWMRWRYGLHVHDALGRVALTESAPERALALADEELAGARRHQARKIEARALELRGAALVALDERAAAEAALAEATAIAGAIGYLPVAWRAFALRALVARRDGRRDAAGAHTAEARTLVERAASSLPADDLARGLRARALHEGGDADRPPFR
jgi:class 3 adenylate cyclase/tetratricopeptide (TPR) repeat protein